ncbi:acyl carrier protein [Cohnella sp. 56]|uniref:acyl carrier protein n=1 Tax=Cohnella sp. 56 TaxID=3113722 RepID=UPI0030E99F18
MSTAPIDDIKIFLRKSIAAVSKNDSLEHELADSAPIQDAGVDSVQLINLVVQIELRYDIVFDDDEMLLENFETVAIMAQHIVRKLGVAL